MKNPIDATHDYVEELEQECKEKDEVIKQMLLDHAYYTKGVNIVMKQKNARIAELEGYIDTLKED